MQAWVAYRNLRQRITAALDGQQRLDETATRKRAFRAWKQARAAVFPDVWSRSYGLKVGSS